MQELYELKEKLMDELKEHGSKDLSAGSLEIVDKLTHTIKNLCKIIEETEESEGYSSRYYPMSYNDGMGGSYTDGRSYRGGRSYAQRRDSMGRYSRDGLADKLRRLMDEAPDDRARMEIQRLVEKMEK